MMTDGSTPHRAGNTAGGAGDDEWEEFDAPPMAARPGQFSGDGKNASLSGKQEDDGHVDWEGTLTPDERRALAALRAQDPLYGKHAAHREEALRQLLKGHDDAERRLEAAVSSHRRSAISTVAALYRYTVGLMVSGKLDSVIARFRKELGHRTYSNSTPFLVVTKRLFSGDGREVSAGMITKYAQCQRYMLIQQVHPNEAAERLEAYGGIEKCAEAFREREEAAKNGTTASGPSANGGASPSGGGPKQRSKGLGHRPPPAAVGDGDDTDDDWGDEATDEAGKMKAGDRCGRGGSAGSGKEEGPAESRLLKEGLRPAAASSVLLWYTADVEKQLSGTLVRGRRGSLDIECRMDGAVVVTAVKLTPNKPARPQI